MQRTDDSGDMVSSEEGSQLRKEAVAWVIRLHLGGLSPEDQSALDAWQAQSPAHAHMFRKVFTVWNSAELRAAAATAAAEPSSFTANTMFRRRWAILAVSAGICVVSFAIVALHVDVATRWLADHRTGSGERRTVELPDRSIAILNTRSAIALSFDGTVRRVRLLSGEAYFSVRHDAARPFIVEGTETAVRAAGTAFVVRAEMGGDQITVIEGTVEVAAEGVTDPPAIVTAGSQIHMEDGRLARAHTVDVETTSAWLRGRLVVQGIPFARVLEELRRYYPGTILFWNRHVGNVQVTGTYNVDDPVGALALLVKTVPISVMHVTDRLVILF